MGHAGLARHGTRRPVVVAIGRSSSYPMSSWFARPYRAFSSYTTTVARGADDSTCPGGASLWIRGVGAAQAIVVVAVVEPVYVLLLTPACVCLSIPGPDSRRRLGPISCGNSPLCRIQNGSLFIRSHRPRGRRLDIRRSPARATARASSFLDDRRTSRRSIRFPLSTRRHSRAGLSQAGRSGPAWSRLGRIPPARTCRAQIIEHRTSE